VCAKQHVANAFEPGDHGSTFGGNPLACAAGLAVMDVLLNDKLVENADAVGNYFKEKLTQLMDKYGFITEVRAKGLMIGVQFSNGKAKEIKDKCFQKGYLLGNVGSSILRILPPLIVSRQDIDAMVEVLDEVLSEL